MRGSKGGIPLDEKADAFIPGVNLSADAEFAANRHKVSDIKPLLEKFSKQKKDDSCSPATAPEEPKEQRVFVSF